MEFSSEDIVTYPLNPALKQAYKKIYGEISDKEAFAINKFKNSSMATPVQTGAATLGTAGLAAAGSYGITQYTKSEQESQITEPTNVLTFDLKKSKSLPLSYTDRLLDFVKQEYLALIVSPKFINKEWWNWAYENKFNRHKNNVNLDPIFRAVTFGYSKTDKSSLSKACDLAYQREKELFNRKRNYLISNIGSFCTVSLEFFDISEPKAITYSEETSLEEYKGGVLKVQENKNRLVKTKEEKNKYWWNWAFRNLLKPTLRKNASNDFKNLSIGFKLEGESSSFKSLNNACDASYKKLYKDLKRTKQNQALINDISNFCSLTYSSSGILFPEPELPSFVGSSEDFDSTYTETNSFVKKGNNKNYLVDPKTSKNENWWIWVYDKFFSDLDDKTKKDKLVSPFDQVTSGYLEAEQTGITNPTSLNWACKAAYTKTKTDFDSKQENKTPLLQLIKDFCTNKEQASNLQELT